MLVTGVLLRLEGLGERPVHADEATAARILANRMEHRAYAFDPSHFHGPLLPILAEPVARAGGATGWHDLRREPLRLVTALAGALLVLVPLLWRRWIGSTGALAAALLLATSPLLVYYSRMYIHETVLALWAMLALSCLARFHRQPGTAPALLAGLFLGLMWATKETFVITVFSWVGAAAFLAVFHGNPRQFLPPLKPALVGLLAMGLTMAVFYTDGLRHPQGVLDAIRTYVSYEKVPGHEKPFGAYLQLLLIPKWQAGQLWWEGLIAVLGLGSLLLGRRTGRAHREGAATLAVFLGLSLLIQLAVYSLIPYKTPWLMVVPWAHACLLAGASAPHWWRLRHGPLLLAGIILGAASLHTQQSLLATGRFASDTRNPYAYVPTSLDLERLGDWLDRLGDTVGKSSLEPVAVVGRDFWPLPWYLRMFDRIGYWSDPFEGMEDLPLVLVTSRPHEAVQARLAASHTALPRGLREGTFLVVHLRNDLWAQWMEAGP